jgi:hypothetical protein
VGFSDAAKAGPPKMRGTARILTIDIERMKGTAEVEFWDLGDFKNRRIHADDVTAWPRTICAAWKWHGSAKVSFAAEWLEGGAEGLARATWEAYDQADIVVGHNLRRFDTRKLRGGWLELGLPEPSPWKTVDTLTVAREFGYESNTLDALCRRLGIPAKTDRYDVETARAACAGDRAAQRKITAYNKGDVVATEGLYDFFRGHMPSHPHVGTSSEPRCNQCGSAALVLQPEPYRAQSLAYPLYRCGNCGGSVVLNRHDRRIATTRGVRPT